MYVRHSELAAERALEFKVALQSLLRRARSYAIELVALCGIVLHFKRGMQAPLLCCGEAAQLGCGQAGCGYF
jgi:hypothetical protein